MDNTDTTVQDAQVIDITPDVSVEVTTENTASPDGLTQNAAEVLVNLESMIKQQVTNIDLMKGEYKKFKEMLNDMLLNDPTYQEHDRLAKDAVKVKSATKSQIMKQPAAVDLTHKVKDMGMTLKETQQSLSDYLREFQRMTGANQIELDNGEIMDIVSSPKLVKKNSKFQK